MKLRLLFIAVLAMLLSGCMDTVMAVPAAAVNGVGNVVGGIWGAVTSIF
jgi:PBP1b-binding outer membrane lipoprotein LpoB